MEPQSAAPVGERTRGWWQKTRGDVGNQLGAAAPAIGHRSVAGGEPMRWPGQAGRGDGDREGEGVSRGHWEDWELTAELVQWSAMAGRPRRRRIDDERAPKVG
jgi:hypothetical protein